MKTLKSLLILSFIFLTSCGSGPVPMTYLYDIDTVSNICGKWLIVDKKSMKLEHKEDLPLAKCNGFMAISYEDYLTFKQWLIEKQQKPK